jgi:hypothetical protein
MIVECPECQAFVETDIAGGYEYLRSDESPSGRYLLLKCRRCGKPILANQHNIGNMIDGDIWDTPSRLYPAAEIHINPNAPREIRTAYEEAVSCYRARAYTAAAIMCRKTLEGIAAVNGIKERSLVGALRVMRDQGLIDERLYAWSDALRLAGNEAAHDVGVTVSQEDARDMLDFSNAILDYLFSFRQKFEEFQQRRQSRRG